MLAIIQDICLNNTHKAAVLRVKGLYRIRLYTSEHERETKFGGIGVHAVGGSLP
jgi:hypothetical protein